MYNVPLTIRPTSPLPLTLEQERRKKMALQSSLLNVNADKRQLEQELLKLRQEAQQHSSVKQKLQKREEEILFYEESLDLIRKDMENLNAVIFSKNKEYILINEQLQHIRNKNLELEEQKEKMARTLELVAEEISKLLEAVGVGGSQVEVDIVSQFKADCRQLLRVFTNMEIDVVELLKINDEIRGENSQLLLTQREKIVRLEYEKKLIEERLSDERRRKQYFYTQEKDAKVHALEVQLLKEQQESQRKLFQMSQMKTSQSSRLSDLSAEKQNSMMEQIYTLVRRNKELEKEKRELRSELDKIRVSYKQVIDKYAKMNLEVENANSNQSIVYMKNLRRLEEERKILEIKIDELIFKNKALEDELFVHRGGR